MTAAIIDETLGGINYILKRYGIINHGPSFTALGGAQPGAWGFAG